jgi:hypothetical protein
MTGPEHFQEAERMLAEARAVQDAFYRGMLLAEAHVHATLANAAATALGGALENRAWADVAGTKPSGSS